LAISGGYNYQNSDQGQNVRLNLNGWFAGAQFDVSERISITGEIDNYYGTLAGKSQKQQNFVLGPQFSFGNDESKLRPFAYVQVGDQRSSSAGSVNHAFNVQMGGGIEVKLRARLALVVNPAEYNLATPNGNPTHSYGAKVGFSWTAWKGTR
jgi:hypothetical protein